MLTINLLALKGKSLEEMFLETFLIFDFRLFTFNEPFEFIFVRKKDQLNYCR